MDLLVPDGWVNDLAADGKFTIHNGHKICTSWSLLIQIGSVKLAQAIRNTCISRGRSCPPKSPKTLGMPWRTNLQSRPIKRQHTPEVGALAGAVETPPREAVAMHIIAMQHNAPPLLLAGAAMTRECCIETLLAQEYILRLEFRAADGHSRSPSQVADLRAMSPVVRLPQPK